MKPTRLTVFLLGLLLATANVRASKSTEECEAELPDSTSRAEVAACILQSMTATPATDPSQDKTYFVQSFGIYQVNSVGGVEPFAVLGNPTADSTIKYLRIQTTVYNAVGDRIRSTLGASATQWLKFTGPLSAQQKMSAQWGPVWYNTTASCLTIQAVTVEFMNGTTRSYAGKTLRKALAPSIENTCRPAP